MKRRDSAKMASLGLLKRKVFWKKGSDVIISVNSITSKIFSRDTKCIVGLVLRPKFGNCSISVREVGSSSIIRDGHLGMTLIFYTNVEKGLKLKVRKISKLIPTFVKVKKLLGEGGFLSPILNRFKRFNSSAFT